MTKRILLALIAMATSLVFGSAFAQDSEISWVATEVAPNFHMLEGQGGFAGGNLGLLTGEDGVVLIDDGIEPVVEQTLAAIERLTAAPVDFVIITHAHADHTGANAALHARGATLFVHDQLRARMVADDAEKSMLPEITFNDSVTFHLNGQTAHVFHVERAHTDGDSVIHFPGINVIHTGDVMFNRVFPFIDLDSGGSVSGFIAAQRKILAMADDDTYIVPGHGPLSNKAELQVAIDMLVDSASKVKVLVDNGASLEDILRANPLADYHDTWNWEFITTEVMTETLFRSLTAED